MNPDGSAAKVEGRRQHGALHLFTPATLTAVANADGADRTYAMFPRITSRSSS
jgi:hypothetical protein